MENSDIVPVYVLVARIYDDAEILGTFTTAKKAKDSIESIADEYREHDLEIEIHALDIVNGKKV